MPGTTDTVKAMLTPGEFVIRKEAVDMIGVPILEKLNDMPEAGGHSEIDRLIAMATLKNMTGMYGGGMVNAKQYMGGGMVNEYQDGGSVSDATATNLMNMLYEQSLPTQSNYGSLQDQDRIDMVNQAIIDSATGTGSIRNIAKSALNKSAMPNLKEFISGLFKKSYKGKIAPNAEIPEKLRGKSLYRYPDGSFDYLGYKGKYSPTEEIPESLLKKRRIQYDDGSFDIDPLDVSGYKHGGKVHKNLKPIPKDNPGLAKLPEAVRNKMGYMQDGGSVLDMQLRRAEPVNFLEQLSYYEPPMAGEMGSQPKRNFFGELEEGQTYGRDILRPHEEKYLDHYNAESIRAKTNLIGFLPEDRELMFEFLNRSGAYDAPGEESVFKNNPNFKVPENEKRLARKLIRFEEKIDERRNDLEKRIRVDSSSNIPSQLDKYPRNLLSEEERKELFEIREQIQNSKSYQAMEDDQSRLYGNRQRREMQKELGLEPKEEYKSLFGFDPNRDRTDLGEDPREYEGEAPNMYDLLERDRKNFYSQYQKPRTGLLNLLGFMKGGMAKKKKKYGYQEGGAVQDSSMMMQPSPFIPFDQRPNQSPASGNWGEFGAYYNALKNNLQAEREELVADTARNALDSLKLDSLIKQMSGDAMRIERSPSEPFFFPNTPVQENFMQKYKEEMIDPTYFPEGN